MRFLIAMICSFCLFTSQAADLKDIEQNISDSVITTKITTKFTKDKLVNPLKISISTHHGIVKLKGYVSNKEAFVQALRIVKNTKGVVAIDADALEVKKVNTALTDAYITAKVEACILKAKVLDDESIPLVGINATTTNGIVTLSGDVKQSSSVTPILKRILAIRGVKQVISKLRVVPEKTSENQTEQVAQNP